MSCLVVATLVSIYLCTKIKKVGAAHPPDAQIYTCSASTCKYLPAYQIATS